MYCTVYRYNSLTERIRLPCAETPADLHRHTVSRDDITMPEDFAIPYGTSFALGEMAGRQDQV